MMIDWLVSWLVGCSYRVVLGYGMCCAIKIV